MAREREGFSQVASCHASEWRKRPHPRSALSWVWEVGVPHYLAARSTALTGATARHQSHGAQDFEVSGTHVGAQLLVLAA